MQQSCKKANIFFKLKDRYQCPFKRHAMKYSRPIKDGNRFLEDYELVRTDCNRFFHPFNLSFDCNLDGLFFPQGEISHWL